RGVGAARARGAGGGARRHRRGDANAGRNDGAAAAGRAQRVCRAGAHRRISEEGLSAVVADFLTIAEAAKLIETKDLSPVELVDSRLARIERFDGKLHSFIRVLADSARAEARAAESEIAAGKYRGPLHGIPLGLKDIYETAGVPTTGHSKVMQDHVPKADAFTVKRLRDAGAVVMGKLATHEFAFGGPSFDLPWPPARNPWDTNRFTGGSSSGTGASVAAG